MPGSTGLVVAAGPVVPAVVVLVMIAMVVIPVGLVAVVVGVGSRTGVVTTWSTDRSGSHRIAIHQGRLPPI
jgi:hypothetical protein